jgi:branched-chain amino acid transport system permease protein
MTRPRPSLGTIFGLLALAFGVLILVTLPFWTSEFRESQFAEVAVYFMAILSLNLLTGYTGQISLGQGAFLMIGGYTAAMLVVHADWTGDKKLLTIPAAAGMAFVAGAIIGIPALRLHGLHVALTTFALAVALPQFVAKFHHFTGGPNGQQLPFEEIPTNRYQYQMSWIVAGICFLIVWLVLRGRTGRAFRSIRDSEIAAVSSGVSLPIYKIVAFGISAMIAGAAGAVWALDTNNVSPQNYSLNLSILIVVGAAIGGLGSLWGMWLGAIILKFLPLWAQDTPGLGGQAPQVVQGIALILIMFLLPGGFAGLIRQAVLFIARYRTPTAPEPAPATPPVGRV